MKDEGRDELKRMENGEWRMESDLLRIYDFHSASGISALCNIFRTVPSGKVFPLCYGTITRGDEHSPGSGRYVHVGSGQSGIIGR